MSEESLKFEKELKAAFARLYPLAREADLPWAACQIERFLKRRLELELERNTAGYAQEIGSVLLEASHPKPHLVDMARIVVERAKNGRSVILALHDLFLTYESSNPNDKYDFNKLRSDLKNLINRYYDNLNF